MKMRFILLISAVLFLTNCSKKKEEQSKIDKDLIEVYILDNNLDARSTSSGLYYTVDSLGSGNQPNAASSVTVAYKGYLTNGTVFDESDSLGISFALNNVIEGWTEGIPLFKEGGAGTLIIPSALGYGDRAVGTIPANSVLIFDIHLIEVL
jgi:FKBP-type peptidyl-prolyl cis-trans isomerase FkpA